MNTTYLRINFQFQSHVSYSENDIMHVAYWLPYATEVLPATVWQLGI